MNNQLTNQVTNYILSKLSEWHNDISGKVENDLSILKTLKLLFLLCTVNNDKEGENLLDLYYNDFVAMPLGPVSLFTYNYFLESDFINKRGLKSNLLNFDDFNNKHVIDDCLIELKCKNKNLIMYSASQLVDLTHKYSCWINNYNKGRGINSLRQPISNDEIKNDEKFYYI